MVASEAEEPAENGDVRQPTVYSTAIDASFQAGADVRVALADNLRPRRASSEAIAERSRQAFDGFDPGHPSEGQGHYVAAGTDPAAALDTVIAEGLDGIRSGSTQPTLTLRDTPELRRLVENDGGDSLRGRVNLDALLTFIDRKRAGSAVLADTPLVPLTADIEAERLLAAAEKSLADVSEAGSGTGAAAVEQQEIDQLVRSSVAVQMEPVTAPESQLSYGKIPNSAGDDSVQKGILQTFELRPGASDVTSYHDFSTLQIAFQHVWSRIFDGQLTPLGQDLYAEYVRLKDFSGSTAPDLQVGSLADLRGLIDEVRKLSQFVDRELPADLNPQGRQPNGGDLPTPTPGDVAKGAGAVASGGVTLFVEWAFNELINAGNHPVRVGWNDFPLKLHEQVGDVIELSPPEQNAVPAGFVEIVLETDANSYKKKITFQQWDRDTQRTIFSADLQNFGGGRGPVDRIALNTAAVQSGTLKFISEDEVVNELLLGRYVLGDLGQRLTDRTRLTFRWKGQR